MYSILHVVQLLVLCVVFVSGCFITNCPPGGKRSDSEEKTHQCEQCGPPGMGGRCYGPQICCSSQFGCIIGAQVTSACQQETRSPSLCHNQAASCDGNGDTGPVNGQCAAYGVCCTPETCTLDEDCGDRLGTMFDNGKGKHVFPAQVKGELESVPPVHGPVDLWFYRRLLHSKPKTLNSDIKMAESDMSVSGFPQGPPFIPAGPLRHGDYFSF